MALQCSQREDHEAKVAVCTFKEQHIYQKVLQNGDLIAGFPAFFIYISGEFFVLLRSVYYLACDWESDCRRFNRQGDFKLF